MLLTVREDLTALSVSLIKDLQTEMDEWLNMELHIRPDPDTKNIYSSISPNTNLTFTSLLLTVYIVSQGVKL